ncbi:MAG: glutathione S-transferase family protein [Pseudomonadota bacterium]
MTTDLTPVLYGAPLSPFTMRVYIQISAKGLDIPLEGPPGGLKSETFLSLNPIGKMPVLQAGDLSLPESEVIVDWLEEAYPETPVYPSGADAKARCRLIARVADLYVMNAMLPLFGQLDPATRDEAIVSRTLEDLNNGLMRLESFLAAGPYAYGDSLTAADCAVAPFLLFVERFAPAFGVASPFAGLSNIKSYWPQIQKDPHVAKALDMMRAALDAL